MLYSTLIFITDRSKVLYLHGLFLICTGSRERQFQIFLPWTVFFNEPEHLNATPHLWSSLCSACVCDKHNVFSPQK